MTLDDIREIATVSHFSLVVETFPIAPFKALNCTKNNTFEHIDANLENCWFVV